MKIKYLNYYTYYKYNIKEKTQKGFISGGTISCFSQLYYQLEDVNSGEIKVFINKDPKLNERSVDNYCMLTMEEVVEYINWLIKVTGIDLSISTEEDDFLTHTNMSQDFFFVNILLKDNTIFEVKLILALIRDMYEYSFNVQTKAIFLMKHIEELSQLDISQRVCLAKNSIPMVNSNHSTYCSLINILSDDAFITLYKNAKDTLRTIHPFYSRNSQIGGCKVGIDAISQEVEKEKFSQDTTNLLVKNYNLYK